MAPETDLVAFLRELRDDLGFRRIEDGFRKLGRHRATLEALGPHMRNSGILLGLLAQWIDAGFESPDLLRRLLARFPNPSRANLPVIDYLHVRIAQGVLAMAEEDFDCALAHFRFIDSLHEEVEDTELLAMANYWAGRCLRKTGRYDDAASYTARGEALALACGYEPLAAIMQVQQCWLAFQKGKLSDALATLARAEEILERTDDRLSRGNVQSAYGRIARRQGRLDHALDCFQKGIAEYRRSGRGDLLLARALLNLGFVNRLMALEIQKNLDRGISARRTSPDGMQTPDQARAQRVRIEQIRSEARAQLQESMTLCIRHHNHRGIAGVHINNGLLALDSGDLECASAEAAEACRHGEEKRDYIGMARARTLECMVENTRLDEQIGDPARHFEAAEKAAREAVQFAGHTQSRRLLARAHIWHGITWSRAPYGNPEAAQKCCDQAQALLKPESLEHEYIWDDLETLKAAIAEAAPVDPALRAWSGGAVGDKSFQQISEEFARIVIPKVWEIENRKISRVATRLSISPKKVRRILHATGMLEPAHGRIA